MRIASTGIEHFFGTNVQGRFGEVFRIHAVSGGHQHLEPLLYERYHFSTSFTSSTVILVQ